MDKIDVTAIELRDYAISLGWSLVTEAVKDGLFVLNSPNHDDIQLIFPKEPKTNYFNEAATIAIKRLSTFYNKSFNEIIEEIREIYDDVICIRYFSDIKKVNSLLFENALKAIEATKQLILSTASTIVNPILHHPRLNRIEPQELLKRIKFRHTQEGSFILKISCPIDSINVSQSVFTDENAQINDPFGRKTFSLINYASYKLLNAIESNTEEVFIQEQVESKAPIVSYNFCDAISDLFDDYAGLPYELGFNWSRHVQKMLIPPKYEEHIKYQYEYKNVIDDIKIHFKEESKFITDTFIATVESLNGDIDNYGRRSGEVKLNIYLKGNVISAKANLDIEQYVIADEAHMSAGKYLKITGVLHPGIKIRLLSNITLFELIGF